ncbi:MAG: MFS transporter, partial [Chloroflexi bacterium]|nr:MFS transporter [Chloroflexota bacterium]
DLRLFKMRLVSLGVAAQFISFIGNSSMRFLLPFYMQAALGFSPQQIGLIFVPASIAMIVTGPVSGRLSDRFGYRWFTVGGLSFSVCGLLLLSTLTVESSVWKVAIGMLLLTGGTGTFYPPNNASIMQQVPESRYGVMSGFINLVRNSANITGTAVATAIVAAVMVSMGYLPNLSSVAETGDSGLLTAFVSGLRTAYIIVAGLVFVGVVFSFIRPAVTELRAENAVKQTAR